MASIVTLRDRMTTRLAARLAAAGYPALADGKILLGKQSDYQQGVPPRVIMTPTQSPFAPVDVYSFTPGLGADEGRAQNQQHSLQTELLTFECRCWGKVSENADPTLRRDEDYDNTQSLYHAVIQTLVEVAGPITEGGVTLLKGSWPDASFSNPQHMAYGREFVFGFQVPVPVLDQLYPYAPVDVTPVRTMTLTAPDGTSGPGCT